MKGKQRERQLLCELKWARLRSLWAFIIPPMGEAVNTWYSVAYFLYRRFYQSSAKWAWNNRHYRKIWPPHLIKTEKQPETFLNFQNNGEIGERNLLFTFHFLTLIYLKVFQHWKFVSIFFLWSLCWSYIKIVDPEVHLRIEADVKQWIHLGFDTFLVELSE